MHAGVLYAALAYTAWGLFPIFFKQLASVNAFEVVMHRTVWSLVFLLGVLAVRKHWAWLSAVWRTPRVLGAFVLSAVLLAANWCTYVWAVQNGHVLDASLGYFILPLRISATVADANIARARIQKQQTAAQQKQLELQVATEVTNADSAYTAARGHKVVMPMNRARSSLSRTASVMVPKRSSCARQMWLET